MSTVVGIVAFIILAATTAILITAIFVSMSITLYLSHRLTEHIE